MIGPSIIPVVLDSDNGLGPQISRFFGGDVDDAFALSFILKSKIQLQELWSVGGNTSAEKAHFNNSHLVKLSGKKLPCFQGLNPGQIKSLDHIPSSDCSYLALGPLTNLAYFLKQGFKPKNIIMTLGRISTEGFYPPFWPIEFNATQDIEAFHEVLKTDIPILVIPLDVAFKLKIKSEHFEQLKKLEIGRYLYKYSQRWRWRSLFLKGRKSFPVWDLLSTMASVYSDVCKIEAGTGYFYKNGLFLCDVLNQAATSHDRNKAILSRKIQIISDFDQDKLWNYFFKTIES